MAWNTCHRLFSIPHFVRTYAQNSYYRSYKDAWPNKWPLYSQIYLLSIGYIELYCKMQKLSYGSKHSSQPLSHTTFLWTYTWNSKTTGFYMDIEPIEWLLYRRRCIFSVLELDARCNWWGTASNSHHSLFLISHLYVLTHTTWNLEVNMDVQHTAWLFYNQRHSLCGLELHERFNWRAMSPDTSVVFWYKICMYTAIPYIHCYLVCNYTWQRISRSLWLDTTQQTTWCIILSRQIWLATFRCSVFSINRVHCNNKITKS